MTRAEFLNVGEGKYNMDTIGKTNHYMISNHYIY